MRSNLTIRLLMLAGLSISLVVLAAQQSAPISLRPQTESVTAQKLLSNAKVRPMTQEELRRFAAEGRTRSKAQIGPRVSNPKSELHGPPLSTVTALNNQKLSATSHPAAIGAGRPLEDGPPPVWGKTAITRQYEVNHVDPGQEQILRHDPKAITQRPTTLTYVCTAPLITDVNGQSHNAVFTPQIEYNSYIIKGCFFGTQTGQAYLIGKFNAPTINLQIQYWNDGEIDARVDPKVSGELDQDNVSLVVTPVNRPQLKAAGFKFVAARSDPAVLLLSIPSSWMTSQGWHSSGPLEPNFHYSSPVTPGEFVPQSATGTSVYVERNLDMKFSAGKDSYKKSNLAQGWDLDSVQWFTYDWPPSCPGVVTYKETFGSMQTTWTDDGFVVDGTDTSCSGFVPLIPPLVNGYQNFSGSAYALDVWARGPRCTDPYTDQPVQKCIQNMSTCGSETCGN